MEKNNYIPGLAGVPAIESSISSIDGAKGILFYRGYSIQALVESLTFEQVSWLLLKSEIPTDAELSEYKTYLNDFMKQDLGLFEILKTFPLNTHPMHVLQAIFPVLNQYIKASDSHEKIQAFLLIQTLKIIAYWECIRNKKDRPESIFTGSVAADLLTMLGIEDNKDVFNKIMDTCLILHAEHTTNASTFANLVVASTLAQPCSVISAAIGALSGGLHGGANEEVLLMLEKIKSLENVKEFIDERLQTKQVVWGMGHREYSVKDPRAKVLEKICKTLVKTDKPSNHSLLNVALEVERVCFERLSRKGVYPNVDFYSGILYQKLGISVDQFTSIFTLSRMSGWVAHWSQQIAGNKIFRPTQIYVGLKPRLLK